MLLVFLCGSSDCVTNSLLCMCASYKVNSNVIYKNRCCNIAKYMDENVSNDSLGLVRICLNNGRKFEEA